MLSVLIFSLAVCAAPGPAPGADATPIAAPVRAADDAFDKRLKEAGDDAAKLWALAGWCEDTDRTKQAGSVLRRLIRVDPDHVRAREKLGHQRFDAQWFTSAKKLASYKQKQEDRLAKEQGLVKYKKRWVHPDDLPFLERGLVRSPEGEWWTREDLEKHEDGWVRQDLVWISPDEAEQLEAGLWKCGEEWLSGEDADRYHNRVVQAWVIPSDHFILRTTCARETATTAIDEMERAVPDLMRLFGKAPSTKPTVYLDRSGNGLGRLCSEGYPGFGPIETRGLVESMRAVFAESWYDSETRTWLGAGASWWDAGAENGAKFGVHDARMALGLAFVDALDPSPKALEKLAKKKGSFDGFSAAYYSEKRLPAWFRWGAASYASRFYIAQVETGGDPNWVRTWSLGSLKGRGGLPSFLKSVFEMEVKGREEDGRMLLASGLIVAFVLDGECPAVRAVHAEFKAVLREGKDTSKILDKLRKEVEKHEKELRAFAGL